MLYKKYKNYQIMKYTTPYPHKGQQILARLLLTIWLPTICSPEITLAAPRSESPVSEASTPWSIVDCIPGSSELQGEHPQAPSIAAEKILNVAAVQSFHAAVDQGDLAQVQKILEKGKTNIDAVNEQGQSALHRAVIMGRKEIAALLLEAGADTTLQDHQGQTALGCANKDDDNKYLSAIATVLQLLSTLDDLIKANLAGKAQNQDEIAQKQNEVCIWLSKLELEAEEEDTQDQEHYRYLKHLYHSQSTCYYKALGDEAQASRHEKLATKHKKPDTTGLATIAPDADEVKALAAKITATIARSGGANASIANDAIQKILTKLKATDIIDDKAYETIESHFVQACQELSSFDDYVRVSAIRENFKWIMHNAILKLDDAQKAEGKPNSSTSQEDHKKQKARKEISQLFEGLNLLVCRKIDQNRLAFIQTMSTLPDQVKETFFSNLLLTKENIKKRYRQLMLQFHPDKVHWVPKEHRDTARNLMTSLMKLINNCRDTLLQNLPATTAASDKFTLYQELGDNLWATAMDYQHAKKGEWPKLTRLLQEDLAHLGKDALNKLRIEKAIHAYEAYGDCCRVADKNRDRLSQIQLRGSMALCCYFVGRYLEAQLYALGAMKLIRQHAIPQALPRAQKILAKVQGRTPKDKTVPTTDQGSTSTVLADTGLGNSSQALTTANQCGSNDTADQGSTSTVLADTGLGNSSQALTTANQCGSNDTADQGSTSTVLADTGLGNSSQTLTTANQCGSNDTTDQGSTSTVLADTGLGNSSQTLTIANQYRPNGIACIQGAIERLIFTSDRSLVKYQAATEDILRAKTQARLHTITGNAVMATGVAQGLGLTGMGVASILNSTGAVTVALGGTVLAIHPAVAIIAGATFIIGGVLSGRFLWKQGKELMKEPVVRKKLNNIMQEALKHYDNGQPQQFLETLATEYATGKQLLSIEDLDGYSSLYSIITNLTEHGFRPDGIAYLLNLIGEVLSSGKVRIPNCTPEKLQLLIHKSFEGSLRQKLIDSATTLDRRIAKMRKKALINMTIEVFRVVRDFFMLRNEGNLAREHVEDAQEMPFTVRLEEMRNIARLNMAMISLLTDWKTPKGDKAALDEAKKLVEEVRDAIDHYGHFYTRPALRLAAIEDFLWIVSGQPVDSEVPIFSEGPTLVIANQSHTAKNMEGHRYLAYLNDKLAAAISTQEKVKIYNQRAAYYIKEANKKAKVDQRLEHWQAAQKDYTSALMLMDHDQTATLGYARCLVGLHNYDQAFRYLKQHPNIHATPDCWIIASIAYRQQTNYKDAKKCILEALRQNPHNQEAAREKAVLEAATSPAVT